MDTTSFAQNYQLISILSSVLLILSVVFALFPIKINIKTTEINANLKDYFFLFLMTFAFAFAFFNFQNFFTSLVDVFGREKNLPDFTKHSLFLQPIKNFSYLIFSVGTIFYTTKNLQSEQLRKFFYEIVRIASLITIFLALAGVFTNLLEFLFLGAPEKNYLGTKILNHEKEFIKLTLKKVLNLVHGFIWLFIVQYEIFNKSFNFSNINFSKILIKKNSRKDETDEE